MLDQLKLYLELGLHHVLDINGYDHILFLTVLTIPFLFNNYKKVVKLVTVFTIGHTLSLVLSTYKIVNINSDLVEFLIPITIAITAIYHLVFVSKSVKNITIEMAITLFFGVVHGLGFSNYFKMIISGTSSKIGPLLEFALGLETAQIIIVIVVLLVSTLMRNVLNIPKKIWVRVVSAIVIGVVIPMIIERY